MSDAQPRVSVRFVEEFDDWSERVCADYVRATRKEA